MSAQTRVRCFLGIFIRAGRTAFRAVRKLLAVRRVLLGEEVLLVGGNLRQVLLASLNGSRNGCETFTLGQFVRARRCGALVAVGIEGVDTLTIGIVSFGGSVRHHQIITVAGFKKLNKTLSVVQEVVSGIVGKGLGVVD